MKRGKHPSNFYFAIHEMRVESGVCGIVYLVPLSHWIREKTLYDDAIDVCFIPTFLDSLEEGKSFCYYDMNINVVTNKLLEFGFKKNYFFQCYIDEIANENNDEEKEHINELIYFSCMLSFR